MLRIAICDDDEKDRAAMKTLVAEYLDLHNYHVRIDEYPSGEAFPAANKWEYALVIPAHNYSYHFGSLQDLRVGDRVTFTDMDAKTYHYKVVALDILGPYDVEEMT